ncbi:ABC transporter permease [Myxococcaceae bacterium GXIMD 01537]
MRTALAIARKELSIYFTTPWAYVVFTAMVALSAFFFIGNLYDFQAAQADAVRDGWASVDPQYRNLTDGVVLPLWGALIGVTLFVAPFLSMRLFAEEKRNKTFELLMTTPVRPIEIVLGKYLGGVGVITATLGLTLLFPVLLAFFGVSRSGSPLEWSTVLLGHAALLLWGATCIAVGMFLSALTESQMLAALLSFVVMLPWMWLGTLARSAEEPLRSILTNLSFGPHLQPLLTGMLEVKSILFFLSVISFSLLLTHRAVEAQRWTSP